MEIRQVEPEVRTVSLEGLYLSHRLQELSEIVDRPLAVANYVTDLNDVIALASVRGSPEKLRNPSDWRLFQELTAQADVIVTGTSYMTEFEERAESGQNVLTQFAKGSPFEDLGDWREQNGLKRNPDLAVVSRTLNFRFPKAISEDQRRLFVFTTHQMQDSEKANELEKAGAVVVGAGKEGVDGAAMVERLDQEGHKVIKLTTGPRVLKILMEAEFKSQESELIRRGALDRLYITKVNRNITDDLSDAITVLEGRKVEHLVSEEGGFERIEKYAQRNVTRNDGFAASQELLVYERNDITAARRLAR